MGITVFDDVLVSLALLGLPKIWHNYQYFVNEWEKLSDWERLWSDLMQEEFRQNTRDGSSSKLDDEEDCALATKVNKGKGNKLNYKSEASEYGKEHTMSKVKCFHYHEYGNIAKNCPQRKKNKMVAGDVAGEALASQF